MKIVLATILIILSGLGFVFVVPIHIAGKVDTHATQYATSTVSGLTFLGFTIGQSKSDSFQNMVARQLPYATSMASPTAMGIMAGKNGCVQ